MNSLDKIDPLIILFRNPKRRSWEKHNSRCVFGIFAAQKGKERWRFFDMGTSNSLLYNKYLNSGQLENEKLLRFELSSIKGFKSIPEKSQKRIPLQLTS